jgi:ferredoxin
MSAGALTTAAAALAVDWTRCDGHGLCAQLLPSRIALDEWGFPILPERPLDPRELRSARRAVAACPALALRLTTTTVQEH